MHIFISHRYCGRILRCFTSTRRLFSDKKSNDGIQIPPEPTTCCMSGCQNCVWIAYAEELSTLYKDNGEKAQQIILDKISDPNLKMFLSMELKFIHSSKETLEK